MAAAYLGDRFPDDPFSFLESVALVDAALVIPLYLGIRFLNRDNETGMPLFGGYASCEEPFLLGLSKGRFVQLAWWIAGIPIFAAGLYPIPPFIAEHEFLYKPLSGIVGLAFFLAAHQAGVRAEGGRKH